MASLNYAPFTDNGSPILPPMTKLKPGQYLKSPNQRFLMILQPDGNLVIYDDPISKALWWATEREPYWLYATPVDDKTGGNYLTTAYTFNFNDVTRNRAWQSVTSTPLGGNIQLAALRTYLSLQDDGNLVLNDTFPLWASNTSIEAFSLFKTDMTILPGESLIQDKTYYSGANRVIFQGDGNLVIYGPGDVVLFQSRTQRATQAIMQEDGNFVIYNGSTILFQTNTAGNPGAYARVQSNGTFSVAVDKPVWARSGFTPTIMPRKKWTKWGPYNIPLWPFPNLSGA